MNPSQRELRHAAAKAFMESLDQLGAGLQASDNSLAAQIPSAANGRSRLPVDAQWEDAAADIEQFMRSQENA